MKTHTVTGGGGLQLHVQEAGNLNGKSIIFIHGFSQSCSAWRRQLHSDLARDFRLVAMDLRGHGFSEKRHDVYGDSKMWADDVHAVITTLRVASPVLCGWSYGGAVMSDYIAFYGENEIAGTNWVGAVSRVGEPVKGTEFIGSEFTAATPGFFSNEVGESVVSLQKFVRLCTHAEMSPEDFYLALGYNMIVPPHVRQGMLSRHLNNDFVIEKMCKPMLLSYGERDAIVLLAMGEHIARLTKHAKLSVYFEIGHSPFWEAPERFNKELREFREAI